MKQDERKNQAGKVGKWGLIVSGLAAFGLSLGLVWLNVQMVNISYDIKQLESELQSEKTLNAKLEVERMHLVSDYKLQEMASRLGLRPPEKEQIRRLR
ncbi:MAG: hypothetical protein K9J48_00595 [Desulfohalobiaceae bacterium]|nr:hypothetical protein [Desulfohalobiaceae bacterium]